MGRVAQQVEHWTVQRKLLTGYAGSNPAAPPILRISNDLHRLRQRIRAEALPAVFRAVFAERITHNPKGGNAGEGARPCWGT